MKKFRTMVSVIIMFFTGVVGFFVGSSLGSAFSGAIFCSMIAGIACVIYNIDNREEE